MLTFEAFSANFMLAGHSYDLISFDFKEDFEKRYHGKVIQELNNRGVKGRATIMVLELSTK